MDRNRLIRKFKDILALETYRNEQLKDSQWAAFAISENIVFKQALDTFMDLLNKAIIEEVSTGWMKSPL